MERFTEGIELFMKKCGVESLQYVPKEQLQIVCQLYTNRAICYHAMGRHIEVIADASFVINKIDAKNSKAYFRRGVARTKVGDWEKALADLEQANKLDPENSVVKEELKTALERVIEERKKQAKAKTPEKKSAAGKVEVLSEDNKAGADTESPSNTAQTQKKKAKKMKISAEQIEKAAARAARNLGAELLQKPKTSYAFENVWRSYKNDYPLLYKFIRVNP